ncbi:MAG: histone deacetylase family protein [Solirubrobacteraceae bacterium]
MASAPVFLEHRSSLEHDTGAHPEQPARISAIEHELEQCDFAGYRRVCSAAIDRDTLRAVHPDRYVDSIERLCARGGGQIDLDTIVSEGSFDAALHAAGGAVGLVDLLLADDAPCGFSAHRPPGHHAEVARAMGFCLFNNVALAARHAIDAHGLERVLILDWDVHHGNGTNNTFHASDQVLFVSIHQSPLYPGTGAATDVGSGPGRGFTVNLPVPAGSDDAVYASLVDHVVVPLALTFAPQLVLISAGYDAHRDDPLAACRVTEAGFSAMAGSMRRVGGELGVPVGGVLEGGYALEALGRSVAVTMKALREAEGAPAGGPERAQPSAGEEPGPSAGREPMAPIAAEARRRLTEWWPALVSQ